MCAFSAILPFSVIKKKGLKYLKDFEYANNKDRGS